MKLLKAIKTHTAIRQREIKTRLGCFFSAQIQGLVWLCFFYQATKVQNLHTLPWILNFLLPVQLQQWLGNGDAEVKMDGKHNCLHFPAELCIQLYGRHHRPFSWLSGYPACTQIRHQRCRIKKSGFMTAHCHNLLINLHWKCEMYPQHDKNICTQGFRHPDTVTVFVASRAGNRCNREHVGRKARPLCPSIQIILPLFQVFSLISISFRVIFISNSCRKISASNLILHHWRIMSPHILVQLLYLDSAPWIKYNTMYM